MTRTLRCQFCRINEMFQFRLIYGSIINTFQKYSFFFTLVLHLFSIHWRHLISLTDVFSQHSTQFLYYSLIHQMQKQEQKHYFPLPTSPLVHHSSIKPPQISIPVLHAVKLPKQIFYHRRMFSM